MKRIFSAVLAVILVFSTLAVVSVEEIRAHNHGATPSWGTTTERRVNLPVEVIVVSEGIGASRSGLNDRGHADIFAGTHPRGYEFSHWTLDVFPPGHYRDVIISNSRSARTSLRWTVPVVVHELQQQQPQNLWEFAMWWGQRPLPQEWDQWCEGGRLQWGQQQWEQLQRRQQQQQPQGWQQPQQLSPHTWYQQHMPPAAWHGGGWGSPNLQAIIVHAHFTRQETYFQVSISSQGANPSGGGAYLPYHMVEISPGWFDNQRMRFVRWETSPPIAFLNLNNADNPVNRFAMPESDVTATAVFERSSPVYIAPPGMEIIHMGYFFPGAPVFIDAGFTPEGMYFSHWVSSHPANFDNANFSTTSLIMPQGVGDDGLFLTPFFNTIQVWDAPFYLDVSSIGAGSTFGGAFTAGSTVSVFAGTPPAGYTFSHWTSSIPVAIGNINSPNISIFMPNSNITLTAHFEPQGTQAAIPLPHAVRFVPYFTVIPHGDMQGTATIVGGSLPPGLTLYPSGEIFGIPTTAGTFEFSVQGSTQATFSLEVLDNTDGNVEVFSDAGYELIQRLPSVITAFEDHVMISAGPHHEFVALWLNGVRLVPGVDFDHAPGSTVITVRAQTFENLAVSGRNTIAAEFRVDGHMGGLRTAAQNFYLNVPTGGFIGNPAAQVVTLAAPVASASDFGVVPQTGVRRIADIFTAIFASLAAIVFSVYILRSRRKNRGA